MISWWVDMTVSPPADECMKSSLRTVFQVHFLVNNTPFCQVYWRPQRASEKSLETARVDFSGPAGHWTKSVESLTAVFRMLLFVKLPCIICAHCSVLYCVHALHWRSATCVRYKTKSKHEVCLKKTSVSRKFWKVLLSSQTNNQKSCLGLIPERLFYIPDQQSSSMRLKLALFWWHLHIIIATSRHYGCELLVMHCD